MVYKAANDTRRMANVVDYAINQYIQTGESVHIKWSSFLPQNLVNGSVNLSFLAFYHSLSVLLQVRFAACEAKSRRKGSY